LEEENRINCDTSPRCRRNRRSHRRRYLAQGALMFSTHLRPRHRCPRLHHRPRLIE
jgi:hypothetical protein